MLILGAVTVTNVSNLFNKNINWFFFFLSSLTEIDNHE